MTRFRNRYWPLSHKLAIVDSGRLSIEINITTEGSEVDMTIQTVLGANYKSKNNPFYLIHI